MLASMKNMQMPCNMGGSSMPAIPCANGKPCPHMPNAPVPSSAQCVFSYGSADN